ncbi:MAG: multidrug effflux MFS transporter [Pseudomonadota bacterium]|uniref:multidrug effflux MFS transporter n=1 Tax=Gallaecimonas pentaromativorans TaxID=584787 RepID=UPI001E49F718|nr:multidrug effflux MFS transporter [Gallaecimonas pentaromativorans]MED5525079.1 multidrug effflux MFS transporter [Pseudomonadota bacterium]
MNNPADPKLHFGFAVLLAMTMALGPFALDTYLPAFPAMAASLGTEVHQIALSISVYVFTLAIGQLVAGPLSDRFGRRAVMLCGLMIFTVASFAITGIKSIEMLLALRTVQAFGAGWAIVCVPALVRDSLSGREAAKFFSLIGLIMVVAPAIAPSFGSLLLGFGWESIFLFLAIYGALLTVLMKGFVFTGEVGKAKPHAHVSVWQRYGAVFAVKPALRYMGLQAFAFSVMMLFITHSSFIYQQHFGVSPGVFALLFGANIVMMLVMNLSNRKLLNHFAPQQILRWSLSLQALGIVALLLVMSFAPHLWLFLPAMIVTVGAMGAITPNIQASYMEYFAEHGGTAAAVLGAIQFSIAGLISAGSALLPEKVIAVVLAQGVCSLLCLALIWTSKNSHKA